MLAIDVSNSDKDHILDKLLDGIRIQDLHPI